MSNENPYVRMLQDQQSKKSAEDAAREQQFAEMRARAADAFRAKAQPLVQVLLPKLKLAQDGLGQEGYALEIDARVEPSDKEQNPSVRFCLFRQGETTRDTPTWFIVEITHLPGGVRVRTEMASGSSRQAYTGDITKRLNMSALTSSGVDQLIELAIANYFRPDPLIFDR